MKMDIVASSKNDEFYTPLYAILPITPYIKPNSIIWCPFDIDESLYVKVFTELGHTVINTHIQYGIDFFNTDIDCDYIISNPPYSRKTEVLERLFGIGTPFAMLVGVVGLFESKHRFNMFKNNKFEIMYMDKRVSYLRSYMDDKPALNPPFSSVYICSNVLPRQIMFTEVDKKLIR